MKWLIGLVMMFLPAVLQASEESVHHAWAPETWHVLPFVLLLLCIAVLGLVPKTAHWWEHNSSKAKVSAILSAPVLYLVLKHDAHLLPHAALEYFQFLTLIGSLFVVAGGIHVTGNLRATPAMNTLILISGFVMASVLGTTGASMVLIYPLLRANGERVYKVHTVMFFIFLVSNMGGLLTPLGDPPLFIGYLRGIDFLWFAQHLWKVWLLSGTVMLMLYWAIDSQVYYPRETLEDLREDIEHLEPLGLIGLFNLPLLAVIVGVVGLGVPTPWREIVLWCVAGMSLLYSQKTPIGRIARENNRFAFGPIVEVGVLFAGIFITMIPALKLLELHGAELGVTSVQQYFWATGSFSSFLDNAPTYLLFLAMAMGIAGLDINNAEHVRQFMEASPHILAAISVGAVFMGANTYIGNAPNFMVKGVAESQGVKMPSFFGYMAWSCAILIPWFVIVGVALPHLI
jgi:Na+/H+ antiporter NhaD/arsenite permease-like protein